VTNNQLGLWTALLSISLLSVIYKAWNFNIESWLFVTPDETAP